MQQLRWFMSKAFIEHILTCVYTGTHGWDFIFHFVTLKLDEPTSLARPNTSSDTTTRYPLSP